MIKYKTIISCIMVVCFTPLWANPTGGTVVAGDVQIAPSQGRTMQIHQNTPRGIIHWDTFNIKPNETVRFHQPSKQAIILNRIDATHGASHINGQLKANGQVWLINPAGMLFGEKARVNVGGLLATTADIKNEDFLSGRYSFFDTGQYPQAAITNMGNIRVAPGGLAALIARRVDNKGIIQAKLGQVLLGEASNYTLDFDGDKLINFIIDKPPDASPQTSTEPLVQAEVTTTTSTPIVTLSANTAQALIDQVINTTGVSEASSVTVHGDAIILETAPTQATHLIQAAQETTQQPLITSEPTPINTGSIDNGLLQSNTPQIVLNTTETVKTEILTNTTTQQPLITSEPVSVNLGQIDNGLLQSNTPQIVLNTTETIKTEMPTNTTTMIHDVSLIQIVQDTIQPTLTLSAPITTAPIFPIDHGLFQPNMAKTTIPTTEALAIATTSNFKPMIHTPSSLTPAHPLTINTEALSSLFMMTVTRTNFFHLIPSYRKNAYELSTQETIPIYLPLVNEEHL